MLETKDYHPFGTWNPTSTKCYILNKDCSRCDIPKLGLSVECQVWRVIPYLLEKYGEPKVEHLIPSSKGRHVRARAL